MGPPSTTRDHKYLIAAAYTKNFVDCRQERGAALKLFGRLTSKVTNDGKVWELYADLVTIPGDTPEDGVAFKGCQYLQKSASCSLQVEYSAKTLKMRAHCLTF